MRVVYMQPPLSISVQHQAAAVRASALLACAYERAARCISDASACRLMCPTLSTRTCRLTAFSTSHLQQGKAGPDLETVLRWQVLDLQTVSSSHSLEPNITWFSLAGRKTTAKAPLASANSSVVLAACMLNAAWTV